MAVFRSTKLPIELLAKSSDCLAFSVICLLRNIHSCNCFIFFFIFFFQQDQKVEDFRHRKSGLRIQSGTSFSMKYLTGPWLYKVDAWSIYSQP